MTLQDETLEGYLYRSDGGPALCEPRRFHGVSGIPWGLQRAPLFFTRYCKHLCLV
jgi:hypothetical protein